MEWRLCIETDGLIPTLYTKFVSDPTELREQYNYLRQMTTGLYAVMIQEQDGGLARTIDEKDLALAVSSYRQEVSDLRMGALVSPLKRESAQSSKPQQ